MKVRISLYNAGCETPVVIYTGVDPDSVEVDNDNPNTISFVRSSGQKTASNLRFIVTDDVNN